MCEKIKPRLTLLMSMMMTRSYSSPYIYRVCNNNASHLLVCSYMWGPGEGGRTLQEHVGRRKAKHPVDMSQRGILPRKWRLRITQSMSAHRQSVA
jgi:hypothetical protein